MSEAIKKSDGSLIQYTEYSGVFQNSWARTYDKDKVPDWLFCPKETVKRFTGTGTRQGR